MEHKTSVSTSASKQEGSQFESWLTSFCIEFTPGTLANSHSPNMDIRASSEFLIELRSVFLWLFMFLLHISNLAV